MKIKMAAAAVALCMASLAAPAHVTVWPRTAPAGGYEKYVVRVPTEGKVATASIELTIPDGLVVVSMAAPAGFRYELKKTSDRVTSIVWTMRIEPGEFAEFAFMARNPAREGSLVWKAAQQFVDGTRTEWIGPAGDKHPASVTSLSGAAAPHSH
jgi:uncharacterized protein YcnI